MRDSARIDPIIAQLRAYWHAHPDLRLGQIISSASHLASPEHRAVAGVPDPFYIEDGPMSEGIQKLLNRMPDAAS